MSSAGLKPGDLVDHFKVIRLIAEGGGGQVYLARDGNLGRKVALKVISAAHLSASAVDAFLREARATATLNHPHVVTIHSVGKVGEFAYLALEYLEGENLRQRVERDGIGEKETLRVALAVAQALEAAHAHGLVHRDLKPENIVLCRDGRLRVIDFGLVQIFDAQTSESSTELDRNELAALAAKSTGAVNRTASMGGTLAGTPGYMAPEQWMQGDISDKTDVWALGLILYELLLGRRPHSPDPMECFAEVTSTLPVPGTAHLEEPLQGLVAECLRKRPEDRPAARYVVEALSSLAQGHAPHSEDVTPFRGLSTFSEHHAELFFGRDEEIAAFVERLRDEPILPVVGPSGAGKSSFVRAGVIPRLKERGRWQAIVVRPSDSPFENLVAQLVENQGTGGHQDGRAATIIEQLKSSPERLALQLEAAAEKARSKILLVIDQAEEVYTLVEDEGTRRRFMDAVCLAADPHAGDIRVIFTVRDDFIGRIAASSKAAQAALSRVTVLRPPGVEALGEILQRPLSVVGYRYEDADMVKDMIGEVKDETAPLPLLQFATSMLWEGRDKTRRVLLRSKYAAMGGVAGALADHGNRVLAGMTERELALVREVLLRLVTPQGTRRVVAQSLLLEGLSQDASHLIGKLTGARLLSVRRSSGADDAELELAHESLIVSWDRLRRWIDEGREDLVALEELAQAARVWSTHNEDAEHAWAGETLAAAERSIKRSTIQPPLLVRRFLDASRAKERRRIRSKRRSLVGALAAMALVTTAALFAVGLINAERATATAERNAAIHRRAEAERESARGSFVRNDLVAARAQLRASLETEDSSLSRALWGRLSGSPLFWVKSLGAYELRPHSISPDGRTLAVPSDNGLVYLVSLPAMSVRVVDGEMGLVGRVLFSPDGSRLAMLGAEVGFIDMKSEARGRWKNGEKIGAASDVSFSPDGKLLALGGGEGAVRILNAESGEIVKTLEGHAKFAAAVAFDPASGVLYSTSADNTLCAWDVASGKPLRTIATPSLVSTLAVSHNGAYVAGGTAGGDVYLWRVSDADAKLSVLRGHAGRVPQIAFSADDELVATAGWDKTARIWQTRTATERYVLTHSNTVGGIDITRDGRFLATNASDGTVRLFELANLRSDTGDGAFLQTWAQLGFSPDGKWIVTAAADYSIHVRDVSDGRLVFALKGHTNSIGGLSFSPDGRLIASSGYDSTLRLWDVARREEIRTQASPVTRAIVFRADSRMLAFGHFGLDEASLWDIPSWTKTPLQDGGPTRSPAFSPDGRSLALISDDAPGIRILDLVSHRDRVRFENKRLSTIAFSPDGRWLGAIDDEGRLMRWSYQTGKPIVLTDVNAAIELLYHPDGRRLITWHQNGITIWTESGERERVIDTGGGITAIAVSPDGTLIAGTHNGTLRLWRTDTGRPAWQAPVLLPSGVELFTSQGWRSLESAAKVEPQERAWRKAIEHDAEYASVASDVLCVRTFDGQLQLWSMQDDERSFVRPIADMRAVRAHERGCLVLAGTELRLHTRERGDGTLLASDVRAFSVDRDDILVAGEARVSVLRPDGLPRGGYDVSRGVTAMGRVGEWMIVGLRTGQIEIVPLAGGARKPSPLFESTPSAAVIEVLPGPKGTFIAGFADGFVGHWHVQTGALLESVQLRGAAVHLLYKDGKLYAASDLADMRVVDLSLFDMSYCELMRAVWNKTPLVWDDGAAVSRAPPADHACSSLPGSQVRSANTRDDLER